MMKLVYFGDDKEHSKVWQAIMVYKVFSQVRVLGAELTMMIATKQHFSGLNSARSIAGPLTLTPSPTRTFWFQLRRRATYPCCRWVPNCCSPAVDPTCAPQHMEPSFPSADVLAASEKPGTLGPSPEPGHCQAHALLNSRSRRLSVPGLRTGITLFLPPSTRYLCRTVWLFSTDVTTPHFSPFLHLLPPHCEQLKGPVLVLVVARLLQQHSSRWQSRDWRKGCL